MTKKITISLEDEVYKFLKEECFNVSALINSLVRKKMVLPRGIGHTNLGEVLDAGNPETNS